MPSRASGSAWTTWSGNLDAKRDWGYAKEYVEGMWRMLQAQRPDTYVLATGRTASVRDFTTIAANAVGIKIAWRGDKENEVAVETATGRVIIRVNPGFYRPAEVDALIGDCAKARRELSWKSKTTLEQLCSMMVERDLDETACTEVNRDKFP